MAVASADYRFLMVDIGQIGSASDSGVWESSVFGKAWKKGLLKILFDFHLVIVVH